MASCFPIPKWEKHVKCIFDDESVTEKKVESGEMPKTTLCYAKPNQPRILPDFHGN